MAEFKGVLIIRNAGCDGCISSAESFALENYNKYPDLLIVFTRVGSMKALRVRSGSKILSSESTYVDSDLIFSKDSLNSVYPIIAHLNSLKVTKIEEQSPFNTGALSRLLDYLE